MKLNEEKRTNYLSLAQDHKIHKASGVSEICSYTDMGPKVLSGANEKLVLKTYLL